jgi:hypothetical protein
MMLQCGCSVGVSLGSVCIVLQGEEVDLPPMGK